MAKRFSMHRSGISKSSAAATNTASAIRSERSGRSASFRRSQ